MNHSQKKPPLDLPKAYAILSRAVQKHHERQRTWAGPLVAHSVKECRDGNLPDNVDLDCAEDLWFVIAYLLEELHDMEQING